jgi:AcrR family transcriptional regulator
LNRLAIGRQHAPSSGRQATEGEAVDPLIEAGQLGVSRGRPRDEAFDGRILREGFQELARGGISHFSVAAVARRAGVAKGSVYLRWPTRDQLILDSSLVLLTPITTPRPGSARDQLEELADQWAKAFDEPGSVQVLLRIDADRDENPELFEQIFGRLQGAGNRIIEKTISQAQASGVFDPLVPTTVVARMFVGAMFVEALSHNPAGGISPEFRRDVVDLLMKALRPG